MARLNKMRRRLLGIATSVAVIPVISCEIHAQKYPLGPITIIVPFPPGGPTDTIARLLVEKMRDRLGQPVIVENVSGANGSIGIGKAIRAPGDGHTLSIGQVSTHVFNGATYSLKYDLINDFEPISLLTDSRFVIAAKAAIPAADLSGFVAWLKANPGKATEANAGVGSMGHISGLYFKKATGTDFQFVPYRGGAPAVQSLVAGETDFMFADLITSLPQIRAGKIKAFAVAGPARLAAAPEIPTVDEAGVSGLYVSFWHGMWASKGTSKNTIELLNSAISDALADTKVSSRLADLGQDIFARDRRTPEALRALQKTESEKWWPIIRAANIKND